ncbi:N-formylglutamate amidohydrolase [Coralloluteibacterium stylophorae]|uniref:N-formylglutamate amidohydrolase n=1 Tax=Coralloluteibacterium stylophorae TaxID=1776034 RepID=A0A8J7VRP1_9GAMM|nr:N-formylglutamate amidohydrolase [Coralloluteibacterium stylophorae]MBS7456985.1 N-formylglutamate amidohydrolase [Coralloluteibacterium stylophorae]
MPDTRTPPAPTADWKIHVGDGPVVTAAIHDGHRVRESLLPWMRLDPDERRREEDPMTGVLSTVGDTQVRVRSSRFEVDHNRPRERSVSRRPEDTWGLEVWSAPLPDAELERSWAAHDRFRSDIRALMDDLVARFGRILVLDIHSYNHRRDGHDADPAESTGNPDIDIGATTLDRGLFGDVLDRFVSALRQTPVRGRTPDVRENVRYPDGGDFPEWLHRVYPTQACVITLEYKKIFMDEWSAQVDLAALEDLRAGLETAVAAVRPAFAR